MNRYLAELVGTFVLVVGGCGSAVIAGDKIGFLGIALAFGLSLLAMAYAIGPISGCHINPAVTIGALIAKRFDSKHVIPYIVAQVIGAVLGAAVVWVIADGMPGGYDPASRGLAANGYGAHSPGGYGVVAAFVAEVASRSFSCSRRPPPPTSRLRRDSAESPSVSC